MLSIELDSDSKRASKSYSFNSSNVSSLDFIGKLNVVLFEAKDLGIITGSPISRRRFLDIHISQQDFSYLKALQRYNNYNLLKIISFGIISFEKLQIIS